MKINSQTLTNVFLIGIFVMMAYLVFSNRDVTINTNGDTIDNTISVDGEAETFVKPDTASVSFSITQKASTTDTATASVNERMNALVSQLQKVGMDEKDIKTTAYDIYPEYSYNNGKQTFEGYRVTQDISVVIRDLENTSDVLATVNSAGVDNVSQLTFFVDDDENIKEELRAQAIADAKKNAQSLAKELGVNLDEIVGYKEGGRYNDIEPLYKADEAYAVEADVAPEPIVPTGQNQYSAHVTVIYKIQ